MKKRLTTFCVALALLGLCACGKTAEQPTWQEQYDLGVRYLSEGKYEEAIIAFTAAIEIDPKQAPAYVGRGDAYVLSGETKENLAAAQADYEKAIELDGTNAEAYLGLADVYIRQGSFEEALAILRQGLEITGEDQHIVDKLAEIGKAVDEMPDRFNGSNGYISYTDLTPEWQEYIASIVNTFQADDPASVFDILKSGEHVGFLNGDTLPGTGTNRMRTQFLGYKIQLTNLAYDWQVEMRPKNGTAYAAQYYEGENSYGTFFIMGECVNWNWNGKFESHSNYIFDDSHDEDNIWGIMRDCLIDGVITRDFIRSKSSSELKTDSALYNYGILQGHYDELGNFYEIQNNQQRISTAIFNSAWSTIEEIETYVWWN